MLKNYIAPRTSVVVLQTENGIMEDLDIGFGGNFSGSEAPSKGNAVMDDEEPWKEDSQPEQ